MTKSEKLQLLTVGLCCGDAIGSTSEFVRQHDIPELYKRYRTQSWPFVQVGEGPFAWNKGQHTDDGQMAVAMLRSFIEQGAFIPSKIAKSWVNWMDGHPPDIGNATRAGLTSVKRGKDWNEGGLEDFLRNNNAAANGSLMRNAPVAAMADTLPQAFEYSIKVSVPRSAGAAVGVGKSELGNALSGLGRNPLGRNINTLDEFGSGAGFSGVFDVESGKWLSYPSGETRLLNGNTPLNLVEQFGGHGPVNKSLGELLGSTSNNRLGFSMTLDEAGNFRMGWNSNTINTPNPNFPGRTVPVEMRQQVLDAIMQTTGRKAYTP